MKLIALDTVRISSAGGRLEAGQEFEVSDHEGELLVARGIACAPASYKGKAARTKAPKAKGKAKAAPAADPAAEPAGEPAAEGGE